MKFDVVVGNPPYQEVKNVEKSRKSQSTNLWSKFWKISYEKSKRYVALVTPTSWTSPSADLSGDYRIQGEGRLWNVFMKHGAVADITNVAKHFPGIGSTFGYVILDKESISGIKFNDSRSTELGFMPKSGFDEVKELVHQSDNLGSKFKIDQLNKPKTRVSFPLTRFLSPEKIQILTSDEKPTSGSDDSFLYLYVYCDDIETAEKIRSIIVKAIDVLNVHCRFSGFLNIQTVRLLKFSDSASGLNTLMIPDEVSDV